MSNSCKKLSFLLLFAPFLQAPRPKLAACKTLASRPQPLRPLFCHFFCHSRSYGLGHEYWRLREGEEGFLRATHPRGLVVLAADLCGASTGVRRVRTVAVAGVHADGRVGSSLESGLRETYRRPTPSRRKLVATTLKQVARPLIFGLSGSARRPRS